jgi:hypothetical protein
LEDIGGRRDIRRKIGIDIPFDRFAKLKNLRHGPLALDLGKDLRILHGL